MARVCAVDGERRSALRDGWECARTAPGEAATPDALGARDWVPAVVPGTAALAWTRAGRFDVERGGHDFDAHDWWFRRAIAPTDATTLRFDGLATLADVWIDGRHALRSESMFVAHEVALGDALARGGTLAVRFASLAAALEARRPRPRWRAQIVGEQRLRFFRTTLLGRIPGWTPRAAAVGPYRDVTLVAHGPVRVLGADVRASRDAVEARLELRARAPVVDATLHVGNARAKLAVEPRGEGAFAAHGRLRADLAPWWPHTHGAPALHAVRATVRTAAGETTVDLGRTGMRSIALDRDGGAFALRINGERVFCRGGVLPPMDPVGLRSEPPALARALGQLRDAGMNMIRLAGTSVYETDALHALCDELGILVWQDLMFANMDYPTGDEAFAASVRREVAQQLDRLQLSPSLAVVCGGSEVEQQAAMMGLGPEAWSNPLFGEAVPALVRGACDAVWVSSSPTEGALPIDVDAGVAHYYGVGAYLRPLEDARHANVRFTSECLAFANVPCDETLEAFLGDGESPTTHPAWKARVPRDKGASWDFDDVRDHYLRVLFGVDPLVLRRTDVARYLELSRVTTAEVMARAMTEWRRPGSSCAGALVLMLRDLMLGPGWGVIDAAGRPKAAYYALKRALAPIALLATDEGPSGLALHVVNDSPAPLDAELRVALYRGEARVGEGARPLAVAGRSAQTVKAESLLGRFHDTTWAYRFGPPGHDVACATLRAGGRVLGRAFHFPAGLPTTRADDLGLAASAVRDGGSYRLTLRARKVACAVAIDARGFEPDDDFFHLEPGAEHHVVLRPVAPNAKLSARVLPINASAPTRIVVP